MDFLQVVLIILVVLLSVMLTVLGVQVFFLLRDVKKSVDKLEGILDDVEKPAHAAAQFSEAVEAGAGFVKAFATKKAAQGIAKRLFKRAK